MLTGVQSLGDSIERVPGLLEYSLVRVRHEEDEGADELRHILVVVHLGLLAERVQQGHRAPPAHTHTRTRSGFFA